ncbi:MAG TPA: hypothetical protein DDZ41_06920, partial [Flavobacterium sp.]|nr:hypothetical protein [Flavobacterium sp.]
MSFFLNKLNQCVSKEKESNSAGVWKSSLVVKHFEKIAILENDLLRLPTPEEFFFLQTDKAFNAFTFIPFICKYHPIKELYATTYSISKRTIDALIELHDKGMIEQITLLISDSMIKRNPVTIDNLMAMQSTRPNLKVLYAWSHAKVTCIKTHHEYFVIEGSGNWSENAHYEQYL